MMARNSWVVFAAVKDAVTIDQVFDRIGHAYRRKPDGRLEATCPLHGGTNRRQFKATANGHGFKCFGCGSGGNVLDLVAELRCLSVREAALLLVDWFNLDQSKR